MTGAELTVHCPTAGPHRPRSLSFKHGAQVERPSACEPAHAGQGYHLKSGPAFSISMYLILSYFSSSSSEVVWTYCKHRVDSSQQLGYPSSGTLPRQRTVLGAHQSCTAGTTRCLKVLGRPHKVSSCVIRNQFKNRRKFAREVRERI